MIEANDVTSLGAVETFSATEMILHYLLLAVGVVLFALVLLYFVGVLKDNYQLKEKALNLFGTLFKGAIFSLLLGGMFYLINGYLESKDDWNKFANAHCTIIEKRDGQSNSGVGLTLSGRVGAFFGSSSSQTVYKCDDGITYTKND